MEGVILFEPYTQQMTVGDALIRIYQQVLAYSSFVMCSLLYLTEPK
jgi:hypothetical protein